MQNQGVFILAIESSCDDTAAAVLYNDKVLSNVVANQLIHNQYGGVVPELASRAHQQNIVPVIDAALKKAGITKEQLSAIAFTQGPGLMGSLLVGSSFAKSLSTALNIPLVAVNHMHAHILAHFIDEEGYEKPEFPFLALTISGGHTQIVRVNGFFDMTIIGETTDDAVGEAFDKSAKILGLPYPGGPLVDKLAQSGNPKAFAFTKPKVAGLDFSFSGLKTAILYFIQKNQKEKPKYKVTFLEDGYFYFTGLSNAKSGQVRNPYKKIDSGIGYSGEKNKKDFPQLYDVWNKMIYRCYNKNSKDYKRYGEKGVKIEERWHCFEFFLEDVQKIKGWDLELFKEKKIQLDKDKNKKNEYSNEGCQWLSVSENRSLKPSYFKKFKATDPQGNIYYSENVPEFAKEHNLNSRLIGDVLRKRSKTHQKWEFELIKTNDDIV